MSEIQQYDFSTLNPKEITPVEAREIIKFLVFDRDSMMLEDLQTFSPHPARTMVELVDRAMMDNEPLDFECGHYAPNDKGVVDFIKMGMGAEQWVAAAFGIARNPDIRRQFDELEEKAWAERQTEEDEFNANFEIIRDLMNARQEAVIALIGEEAFDDLSDDRVRELVHKPAEEELAAMKAGLKVKEDDFDWEMTARRRLMGEYIDEAIAKMGEETFYNLPEDRRRALVHDRADRVIDVMKRVRERKAAEDQTQKQESYIEIDPDMPMKDFAAFCLANVNRVSPEDADKFRDALESGDQDVEAAIEGAPNRCKALIKLVGLSESCHEQFDDDFFKVWSPSEDDLREFVTNPNMRSDLQIMVAGSLAFDKLGVVKKRFDAIMKEEVVKVAN